MDYKKEIEKIGCNTREVANRVEKENNNPILNVFLNK